MTSVQFLLINIGAFVTAIGGVFLKKLADNTDFTSLSHKTIFKIMSDPYFWCGAMCYVLPVLLWAYMLKSMELTKLQPLLAIVYLYTIAVAWIFLGESLNTMRIIGVISIIIGVVFIGKS
jgi:drug/metabolite transporter (DMT)-like permease